MNPTAIQNIIKLVALEEASIKEFKAMPDAKLKAMTADHLSEVDIFLLSDSH